MKKILMLFKALIRVFILTLALIVFTSTAEASIPVYADPSTFVIVMEKNTAYWDGDSVRSPHILKENGIYKMWFTATGPGVSDHSLAYAVSTDGVNWTRQRLDYVGNEPMPYVIKQDSQYVMYYNSGNYRIGRQVSSDGINWTNSTEVLTGSGIAGTFDQTNVWGPVVLEENGQFSMWYLGFNPGVEGGSMGRVTSGDGTNWVERQLVMPRSQELCDPNIWDSGALYPGEIVKETDGSYTMYIFAPHCGTSSIGMAKSSDGINWTDRQELINNMDLGYGAGSGFWNIDYFKDTDGKEYLYFGVTSDNLHPGWGSKIGRVELKRDSDGDGINDDIDVCPNENAAGFDANNDGCLDNIQGLTQIINTLPDDVLSDDIKNSLVSKVDAALRSVDKEKDEAAINQIEAFINEVNAQKGKKISVEAADLLINFASNIIAQIQAG